MDHYVARGLTADWLNAWLAAIGVTVLVPQARLGWTDDPVPRARFTVPEGGESLAELIAAALPSVDELNELVIAGLTQNIPVESYRVAAATARDRHDLSLAVLTTDIGGQGKGDALPNGPFNLGAPRGETLFTRLRACAVALSQGGALTLTIQASFDGYGRRVDVNGLGFDYRRITGSVPRESTKTADPLIECLCFFGLLLHPVGGDGRSPRARGWSSAATQRNAFRWPTWSPLLDRWAIEALLDVVHQGSRPPSGYSTTNSTSAWSDLRRIGVTALYGSVPFIRTGGSDTTRGYASERMV